MSPDGPVSRLIDAHYAFESGMWDWEGRPVLWYELDWEVLIWNMAIAGALYAAECRGFERGYTYAPEILRLSAPR